MNFQSLDDDIVSLKKSVEEAIITNASEQKEANDILQVCTKMHVEVLKFAEALKESAQIINRKLEAYAANPAPQAKVSAFDDFDSEPPCEADELAIEIEKSTKTTLF
jgi:hypothetical protein